MSKGIRVPTYRQHTQSGQAIVTLPDGLGGRKDVLLGKYGTKESRTAYARVIAEWEDEPLEAVGPGRVRGMLPPR
jgi:hypothetical protein